MTKEQKENITQLKPYQVFLLSCLLGSILILNSVYVNKNRDLVKLNKEKGILKGGGFDVGREVRRIDLFLDVVRN